MIATSALLKVFRPALSQSISFWIVLKYHLQPITPALNFQWLSIFSLNKQPVPWTFSDTQDESLFLMVPDKPQEIPHVTTFTHLLPFESTHNAPTLSRHSPAPNTELGLSREGQRTAEETTLWWVQHLLLQAMTALWAHLTFLDSCMPCNCNHCRDSLHPPRCPWFIFLN